jgi:hypothetical protein
MMFRRLAANLRAQNWTAIGIEFVLLVTGVFLGLQASNWNQERQEKQELEALLGQLKVEMASFDRYLGSIHTYYAVTDKYARQAAAGWSGRSPVSDQEFVIAAYQASQVTAAGNDTATWSVIFGADRLRKIDEVPLRRGLTRIMTFDYGTVDLRSVSTPYRQNVRRVIPGHIQEMIRERCGDRPAGNPGSGLFILPERCDLTISPEDAAFAAARLREMPSLQNDLFWHQAAVDNQLLNIDTLRALSREVSRQLES